MALAAVLELAYRADSNSAVREDLWVRVPPAVPSHSADQFPCRAVPPDATLCIDVLDLDDRYAFVLGLYLGDGMLSRGRRHVWRLRVSLDTKYPGILDEARTAIGVVAGRSVGSTSRPGCVEIRSDWKHWICLFPQHGPGPKHRRPIRLEPWQVRIIEAYPAAFLAGLIRSDGCRCVNRVKGHGYPRYLFSNSSAEIRAAFIWACGLVGVDGTASPSSTDSSGRSADTAPEHRPGPSEPTSCGPRLPGRRC